MNEPNMVDIASIKNVANRLDASARYVEQVGLAHASIAMLAHCTEGSVTYYDGTDDRVVGDLSNALLLCSHELAASNPNLDYLQVQEPKVTFYRVSHLFGSNRDFEVDSSLEQKFPGTSIAKGCTIGANVTLHPNVVVRANTTIGDNCVVESGTVVGSTGLLWTIDPLNNQKVMLNLTGGTDIGAGSYICANNTVVRGAGGEKTVLGENVMLAPNNAIGHGAQIGKGTHFANGILIGGTAFIDNGCFLGSGSVIQPGVQLSAGSVLGANATLTKSTLSPGVYAGTPAKRIGDVTDELRGVPASHARATF